MKTGSFEIGLRAFQIESECLKEAFNYIDKNEFERAVEILSAAPKIAASGCGHTGIACRHFTHLMCCIERPAGFICPSEAVHGATGYLQRGDVMLLASRGGKTSELVPIMQICKKKGVLIIVVTENTESLLAKEADVLLRMFVNRETDKYNCQGTTSNTVLNALFDALQSAVIERIDFQNEQFALVHPGGAVGKRLNQ